MRCEDFESRLNEVLDERRPLSSAADLEGHVRQCGACRKVARSYEAMLAGLHYDAPPAEPVWLTARVVAEAGRHIGEAGRGKVLRFPRRAPAVALAASVLLLAVGLAWVNHRRGQLPDADGTRNAAQVAQVNPPADEPVKVKMPSPRGHERPTGKRPVGPEATSADGDDLLSSMPAAKWAQPGAEWAHGVADGLQPVTRPTVGAINGFLNLWGIGDRGIGVRGVGERGRRS